MREILFFKASEYDVLDLIDAGFNLYNKDTSENISSITASVKQRGHHYGAGGLFEHTWEVIQLVEENANLLEKFGYKTINRRELFVSAFFHDIGKIWDYKFDCEQKIYVGTPHKRLIHHV